MSEPAIRVENLSKQYLLGGAGGHQTFRESINAAVLAPIRRLRGQADPGGSRQTLWALDHVSFDVPEGEVLGIMGHNGAGKSTLLKIFSRITEPTAGRVRIRGRVGSLLEVGTGFHSELSGRENIFLNAAILGMSRAETLRKFDEIVGFAEMEKFIDTPVKRYSSGMYVRLAFAVAAHLEPDVLLIDEVLSVGDMGFRKKCLDKMSELRRQVRAIVFVSHDMILVRAICSSAILFSRGKIAATGSTDAVVPLYEKMVLEQVQNDGVLDEQDQGNGRIAIGSVRLLDGSGRETRSFSTHEPMRVEIDYTARGRVENAVVYVGLRRPDGFICAGSSTKLEGLELPPLEGSGRVTVDIPQVQLIPGYYVADVLFYDENFEFRTYFLGRKRMSFEVTSPLPSLDDKYGVVYQKQRWDVSHINEGRPAGVRHD